MTALGQSSAQSTTPPTDNKKYTLTEEELRKQIDINVQCESLATQYKLLTLEHAATSKEAERLRRALELEKLAAEAALNAADKFKANQEVYRVAYEKEKRGRRLDRLKFIGIAVVAILIVSKT